MLFGCQVWDCWSVRELLCLQANEYVIGLSWVLLYYYQVSRRRLVLILVWLHQHWPACIGFISCYLQGCRHGSGTSLCWVPVLLSGLPVVEVVLPSVESPCYFQGCPSWKWYFPLLSPSVTFRAAGHGSGTSLCWVPVLLSELPVVEVVLPSVQSQCYFQGCPSWKWYFPLFIPSVTFRAARRGSGTNLCWVPVLLSGLPVVEVVLPSVESQCYFQGCPSSKWYFPLLSPSVTFRAARRRSGTSLCWVPVLLSGLPVVEVVLPSVESQCYFQGCPSWKWYFPLLSPRVTFRAARRGSGTSPTTTLRLPLTSSTLETLTTALRRTRFP